MLLGLNFEDLFDKINESHVDLIFWIFFFVHLGSPELFVQNYLDPLSSKSYMYVH